MVCDASSCTEGLEIPLLDEPARCTLGIRASSTWSRSSTRTLLPRLPQGARLPVARPASDLLVPPAALGIDGALSRVAAAVADEVVVPDDWGCCAFAGAPRDAAPGAHRLGHRRGGVAAVRASGAAAHASVNRTCELGMSRATGQDYVHLLESLLERATR